MATRSLAINSQPLGVWSRERCLTKAEMLYFYSFVKMNILDRFERYNYFAPVHKSDCRR